MEEFILDELIRDYKYKCTRVGRFPILLSGSLIFSFSLASMLGWIIIFRIIYFLILQVWHISFIVFF